MTRVAKVSPSIRLVVFQFLVNSDHVPAVIRLRRRSGVELNLPDVPGKEVLPSTKDVYLLNFLDGIIPITGEGPYELVDSWFEMVTDNNRPKSKKQESRSKVRYVFCHKDHVRTKDLHPEFVAERDDLVDSLVSLANDNLWMVQGHINPYFDKGKPTVDEVMMFDCTGRSHILDRLGVTIKVWSGGKDRLGQGIGEEVPITEARPKLKVVEGEIVLQ
ncbi:MAG: hypothetical protein Q7S43_03690 [bacterium]|nr:hypothetical protein [bacterium]